MKINNNIPAYRFQGYTDAWELRKLGEVARFRRGSFPQPYGNSEWYDGDGAMPFVQVADVTDEMNLVEDTKQKISKKAQPLSVYAEKGSVLVTLQGSIGRVAITQYGAFIDRTVLIFENFYLPIDNLFWAYVIKQKFIEEAKSAPGGTIKTITKEVLSDFNIKLPTHAEQEAIGTFFSTLDQQITLHQRKLDTLKEQKMTYLKLLFPAKGQTKPALRFQGFEDDWEGVKLGEVLTVSKLKNKENEYSKLDVLSVSREQGTVNQIEYQGRSFASDDVSGYKIVKVGQMIYTKSPLKGAPYGIFQTVTINGIVSPLYAVYNSSGRALASFVSLILKEDAIATHYLSPLVTKGAKNTINVTDEGALEGKVKIPTLPEQEVIGTFFSTLDQEIAQVEDKLASLKEMKKTLLRKLFV
ncbi:TPA: restriction endonuclease subunit S [Streptococcus suis]|nr:restriction endonuclease subunit S [Streptococcus suis]